MTNTALARRAVLLYNNPMVPKATNRFNQRAWLRSVRMLGTRWVLAQSQPLVRVSAEMNPDTLNNWKSK